MHYEDHVYIIVVLYTCKKVIRKIVNVLSLDFLEATATMENFDIWFITVILVYFQNRKSDAPLGLSKFS